MIFDEKIFPQVLFQLKQHILVLPCCLFLDNYTGKQHKNVLLFGDFNNFTWNNTKFANEWCCFVNSTDFFRKNCEKRLIVLFVSSYNVKFE